MVISQQHVEVVAHASRDVQEWRMKAIMFAANVIDYRVPERAPCAALAP